ncbi:hypothetical protein [Streptomyces yaizuensis]|uniref:Uncharacterized protein n=1 Tax=Streptomyces yaizuensis TaxID=2989713 RepID=A0ABQ5P009_9ACTN|nr:hypothetical protein [Streptomyces sp. YSPA8]GLF95859.1 hypothetical protein SYYSPA8_16200 [Streptomyces sp. YSPA8]
MSVTVPRVAERGRRRRARLLCAVSLAVLVVGGTAPGAGASGSGREPVPSALVPGLPGDLGAPGLPGVPVPGGLGGRAADSRATDTRAPDEAPDADLVTPAASAAPSAPSILSVPSLPSVPPSSAPGTPSPPPPRTRDGGTAEAAEASEDSGDSGDSGDADGPRSPANRRPARPEVTRGKGFTAVGFDLGDTALPGGGGFRAPVRGQLVLPASGPPARLVLLSHLRSGNCSTGDLADGGVFAYPCPAGSEEVRYDRGWRYLAESLARRGYASLIPDLGPIWVGHDVRGAYDQVEAVLKVFGEQRDALARAVEDGGDTFGTRLRGRVDLRTAALVTHSRSAYAAEPMARRWAAGPTRIRSQYLLQPALETSAEDPYGPMSAPPADLPWLTVLSAEDADVGYAGNVYLSDHLGQRRTAPAGAVTVRGFGHNYFNRALSAARADDRVSCTRNCPGPAAHERLLTATLGDWLAGTWGPGGSAGIPAGPGRSTGIAAGPVRSTGIAAGPGRSTGIAALDDVRAAVPRGFGGVPARWLIPGTPSVRRETVVALPRAGTAPGRARVTWSATGDATARLCRQYHPQDPARRPDRCDDTALGVVDSTTPLLQVRWKRTGGLRIPLRLRQTPDRLTLHLAPFGGRDERSPGTPLRLTLRDTGGRGATVDLPATDPALANAARGEQGAAFQISTVRVPLERFRGVDPSRLDRLTIGGTGGGPDGVLLRQAEFTGAPPKGTPANPAPGPHDQATGPTPQGARADRTPPATPRPPRAEPPRHMLSDTGGHTLSAALVSLALIAIGLTLVRHARSRRP